MGPTIRPLTNTAAPAPYAGGDAVADDGRQGRPPFGGLALAVLADYHAYCALVLGGEAEQAAAEQSGGTIAVHAARLAAELAALLSDRAAW